jgi:beta-galactosidase GanA
MPKVDVREKQIYVDDTPVPIISGEVHYWRLSPDRWREILERVR